MRKYFTFVLFLMCIVFLFLSFKAEAATIVTPYAQTTTNQLWWLKKKGVERFEWIDHTGRTNIATRTIGSSNIVRTTSSGMYNRSGITVDKDLKVLEYRLEYSDPYEWSIDKLCPGTYNMTNGTWYTQLTDDAKTAMWVSYTNAYFVAKEKEEQEFQARLNAPAAFDVTKTPDEYKAYILGDRSYDDLMPQERREISLELSKYTLEWIRINEPETWVGKQRFQLPGRENNLSEQQKIHSARGRILR